MDLAAMYARSFCRHRPPAQYVAQMCRHDSHSMSYCSCESFYHVLTILVPVLIDVLVQFHDEKRTSVG